LVSNYDPYWVSDFYDKYAEKEWQRWDRNAVSSARFYLHVQYLRTWIKPGMRVLEAGAASGRFTQVLAELGAKVVVLDLSAKQLELNRENAQVEEFEGAVEERVQADICDLSRFTDASFDAVVCYGGPLSYVFDRRDTAIAELLRVTKPGGPMLLSVMSKWGTHQEYLVDIMNGGSADQIRAVVRTGDIHPVTWPVATHRCHLYTAAELDSWLRAQGSEVLVLSSSNALTTAHQPGLEALRNDRPRWQTLMELEVEACASPGCLDMGTHLIAVVRRLPDTI
jgi:SAM-dependent methyltransferase